MKKLCIVLLGLSLVSCTLSLQNSRSDGHSVVDEKEDLKQEVNPKLDQVKK